MIDDRRVLGLRGTKAVIDDAGNLALLGAVEQDGEIIDTLFAHGRVVLSEGDAIRGRLVSEIFPNFGMNNHGDIAFRVEFEDGSRGVVLATIPEPSSVLILIVTTSAICVWHFFQSRTLRRC
jgi:hypothetical protein